MIGLGLYACGGIAMFGYAMHETVVPMTRGWLGHTLPHHGLVRSVGMWALAAGALTAVSSLAAIGWPVTIGVIAHNVRQNRRRERRSRGD